MDMKWVMKDLPPRSEVVALSQQLNISQSLATLLVMRGHATFEQARHFFRPTLDNLLDPFLMKDMDLAVNRLSEAISSDEKILIYGDYDVDGTTSVALLYLFLQEMGAAVAYYVPDRYSEGYGISEKGAQWAADRGFHLIIALDCGIRANHVSQQIRDKGMDLIICDHHLPGDELPLATAILDPKRSDCPYPFKELSGCGVGFKLLQGFCLQNTLPLSQLYSYLDLVAVSIASDIVPIVEENRILAYYGLRKLNKDPLPGLGSLSKSAGLIPPLSISDVVFYLGPRINATGRLSHAHDSVQLLVANETADLEAISSVLNQKNTERKQYDSSITQEALEMIRNDGLEGNKSTVLYHPEWHKGVVGIVASRCIEHYYRPTVILTKSGDMVAGSARSIDGFNLYQAIAACDSLLEHFGGHTYAAGVTMRPENVEAFKQKFEQVVDAKITEDQLVPKLKIDLEVDLDFISFKTLNILNQMAPFGPKNPQPVFRTDHVRCKGLPRQIKEEHLKLRITHPDAQKSHEAIAFGFGALVDKFAPDTEFRVAYHIETNEYMGNKSLQLIIKDIKFYH